MSENYNQAFTSKHGRKMNIEISDELLVNIFIFITAFILGYLRCKKRLKCLLRKKSKY